MLKTSGNYKYSVSVILLLFLYPVACSFVTEEFKEIYMQIDVGRMYLLLEAVLLASAVYTVANMYLISKAVKNNNIAGIVMICILLAVYSFILPVLMLSGLDVFTGFVMIMLKPEYMVIPSVLLVYTVIYFIYWRKTAGNR